MKICLPEKTLEGIAIQALNRVEEKAGFKFVPSVKGMVCKMLLGTLRGVELDGGKITHKGAEKMVANLIQGNQEERKRRKKYKRKKLIRNNPPRHPEGTTLEADPAAPSGQ